MKKLIICFVLSISLLLPGCISVGGSTKKTDSDSIRVWWGSKAEIVEFLSSPNAKSDRWMVEAIGEGEK